MGDRPLPEVLPASLPRLGHAVIKVRDLEHALAFYRDALGLREVARHGGDMVFLSSAIAQPLLTFKNAAYIYSLFPIVLP